MEKLSRIMVAISLVSLMMPVNVIGDIIEMEEGAIDRHIIDNIPPTVRCKTNPEFLWPPNHKMENVNIEVTVTDILSGPAGFVLTSINIDEQDGGHGDINNDVQNFVIGTPDTEDFYAQKELLIIAYTP